MRSNKRYSNVAFTKRVDYPGGTHRPPRGMAEPIVCSGCGAVYVKRRWWLATDLHALEVAGIATPGRCPACALEAKHQVRGYLVIEGAFVRDHRAELEHLVEREAARAAEDNPLARVIGWEKTPERLTASTTTEHLAKRLGDALHGAFHGEVAYKFSHGEPFARVTWHRD